MKIYFGFTVAGDRSSIEAARRVIVLLEEKGHEVLTRHLVSDDAWSRDRLIPPQFEAGYLLGTSTKKAILLYRCEIAARISLLITVNSHSNCVLVPYTDVGE